MNPRDANHLLFCLRYGIGDVVMEMPALNELRRCAPDAHITALGASPAVQLLEGDSRVDEVVDAMDWGLEHRWDPGDEEARKAVGAWLDEEGHDLVLDPTHAIDAVRDAIYERDTPVLDADRSAEADAVARGQDGVAAIKAAVRAGWGMEVGSEILPRVRLLHGERDFARRFLAGQGMSDSRPVGISPVASLPMKRWAPEAFGGIMDWVIEQTGRPVVLFAGPQHEAATAALAASRHGTEAVAVVGAENLRCVAALFERCAAFVCNDTGLMHMAAAVGTPTIGVFGPTSPTVYLPPAPHARGIGGREIDCPYRNTGSLEPPGCWTERRCLISDKSCIHQVATGEVERALSEALAGRAQSGNLRS